MGYITIKDFANRVGVSPQAIYQRLDKDLKSYVKVIEGKKSIDLEALGLFTSKTIEQDIIKALQDTLTVLSNQLIEKDKQIAFLQAQLHASQALHAGTMQKQLITEENATEKADAPDKPPESIWKKIFKRG